MYNEIVEVESNVVKITTGGIEKEYNKTDLKCTSTDISVAVLYYTDGKDTIVAQWNDSQADEYGYTLSSLKIMIDTVLSLEVDSYTSSEVDTLLGGKANASDVATVLFKSITPTIITGKSLETSIYAIPLPTDGLNYMLKVYSQAQVSTFAGLGITQRLRVGSYASPIDGLTGANSIGLQTLIATNGVGGANQCPVTRNFIWRGGVSGSIYGISLGSNIPDDGNSLGVFSTLATKDFTTQHYLYVSFNPNNATAVVAHDQIYITLIKI